MKIDKDFKKTINKRIAELKQIETKTANEKFCIRQEILALEKWENGLTGIVKDLSLKQQVKIKLAKTGITQTEIAKELGVSKQALSSVLSGATKSARVEEWLENWLTEENKKLKKELEEINNG